MYLHSTNRLISSLYPLKLFCGSFLIFKHEKAGPNGEPAVSIVCPDDVMDRGLQSGIVKGMINEGQISNREQDTFAEAVVEAKEGRRTSVFASLLDPEAVKDLNAASVLSIIADEDDD